MIDFFNYYSVSLFLGGVIALLSGGVVYFTGERSRRDIAWLVLNLSTAIWSFGYFLMITASRHDLALTSNWILHAAATIIPLAYFFFIVALVGEYEKYRAKIRVFSVVAVFFLCVNMTSLFVTDVFPKFIFNYAPNAGPLYIYYTLYFFGLVLYALLVLFRKIREVGDPQATKPLRHVFYSSILGFVGGGNVFFLTFNIDIPPYLIILFSFYPIVIAYSIAKYNLFNVRVIATEAFIFVLWIFLLIQIFIVSTITTQVLIGVIFLSSIIAGIILIQGVNSEIKTRERIKELVDEMKTANQKLRELDNQKSEFVAIASHQLRNPLTVIQGYTSMLLEGSFGKITKKLSEPITRINESTKYLVQIIEDFLDIARIERGEMKYDFKKVNLQHLLTDVVEVMSPVASTKGLEISFTASPQKEYFVHGDPGKIRQILLNIVDNAMKYTPEGSISITMTKDPIARKILIAIMDTGIGIEPGLKDKLFRKFARGQHDVNTRGTGLGLFVAKNMIAKHKGRIWVESPGPGQGSTFFIELPAI